MIRLDNYAILDPDLFNTDEEGFKRLKVQAVSLQQDFVVNGFGNTSEWYEENISSGGSVYAEFTVPV